MLYAVPLGNNGLEDNCQHIAIGDDMPEDDEQVEEGAVKHEIFSLPSDTRRHGFIVDKSDGSTEEMLIEEADIPGRCKCCLFLPLCCILIHLSSIISIFF